MSRDDAQSNDRDHETQASSLGKVHVAYWASSLNGTNQQEAKRASDSWTVVAVVAVSVIVILTGALI